MKFMLLHNEMQDIFVEIYPNYLFRIMSPIWSNIPKSIITNYSRSSWGRRWNHFTWGSRNCHHLPVLLQLPHKEQLIFHWKQDDILSHQTGHTLKYEKMMMDVEKTLGTSYGIGQNDTRKLDRCTNEVIKAKGSATHWQYYTSKWKLCTSTSTTKPTNVMCFICFFRTLISTRLWDFEIDNFIKPWNTIKYVHNASFKPLQFYCNN